MGLFITAMLSVSASQVQADCLVPPANINGNSSTTVTDLQCQLLLALWALEAPYAATPDCAAVTPEEADLDCDGKLTVGDVVISIYAVLTGKITSVLDGDGSSCVDACEAPPSCTGAAEGGPCDDGDRCTQDDDCSGGLCIAGALLECGSGTYCGGCAAFCGDGYCAGLEDCASCSLDCGANAPAPDCCGDPDDPCDWFGDGYCDTGCAWGPDELDCGESCSAPPGESCGVPECDSPCAVDLGEPVSLGCMVRGGSETCECGEIDEATECPIAEVLADGNEKADGVPAPANAQFRSDDALLKDWIKARWKELAELTIGDDVKKKIKDNGGTITNYPDGAGWIRTDFHGALVDLPKDVKAKDVLKGMLDDPIKASGNAFKGWVGWPAAGKDGRKVGDVIDLDIWGPDNGAVAYILIKDDLFCVVTVTNEASGSHPVAGLRCWGFTTILMSKKAMLLKSNQARWKKGCGPYVMFFTIAIDSPSVAGSGAFGVSAQRSTWNALLSDFSKKNQADGGVSNYWLSHITTTQPSALKPGNTKDIKGPGDLSSTYVSGLDK